MKSNNTVVESQATSDDREIVSPAQTQLAVMGELTNAVATFDVTSPDGAITLASMNFQDQISIVELAPITINTVDVVIRPAEVTDKETGEVKSKWRIMLIDVEGNVFATMSDVVARTLGPLIISPLGRGSFKPPLPILFKRVTTQPPQFYISCSIPKKDLETLKSRIKKK